MSLSEANRSLPSEPEMEDETFSRLGDRFFYALFQAAIDAMLIVDDQGHLIGGNQAACVLLGMDRKKLLKHCMADLVTAEFNLQGFWQALQQQGQDRGEFAYALADGVLRRIEYAATANFIPQYHLLVLRDVTEQEQSEHQRPDLNREFKQQATQRTSELQQANLELLAINEPTIDSVKISQRVGLDEERKQAALLLKDSEAQYRRIVETANEGIWILDIDNRTSFVNPRMAEMLGYSTEEMLGKPLFEFMDAAGIAIATQQLERRRQGVAEHHDFKFQHKNGSDVWTVISTKPIFDDVGQYVGVLGMLTDISDRKATEAALKQREQEFRTLAENAPDSIIRCNREFRFLYTNPTVSRLTGIPSSEFLGKTSRELGFPQPIVDLWHYGMERVFSTGREYSLEYEIALDIGYRSFYSRIVPELNSSGSIDSVLIVSRDITDLKQAQMALMQQAEREYTLRFITQHIRETLDLEVILATAVVEVHRTLQADRTLILQLNANRSGVIIQEAVQPEYPVTLGTRWYNECFPPECDAAYNQGQGRIVPDVTIDHWGDSLAEFMQRASVQSKMVAPITQLRSDGSIKLWGLLVTHACAAPRQWQQDELDLLQQVANQLAIAIQQAELYHQVQQLNINLEQQIQERTADLQQALEFEMLLKRITDQLRDSLEEEQILETVVQELGQVLQSECCDTGIYNADLTTSTIAHEFIKSLPSAKGITFEINEATHSEIYPALFQGQSLQFCTLTPCAIRPEQRQFSILACPIMDDQRVLGDLWLYKKEPSSPSEVRLVQQVANQCAIALRQSRLYQAAQTQVRELERLNQLKDDFLSTVSHELRTPISNIQMAIQMLEISLRPLGILIDSSQPSSRYFQILKTECQRETQLINDLLDLTHLDAGTEPLNLTSTDLRFVIPHIAESFIERTQQNQQQFELSIPNNLPPITTDLSYLERIVTELLNNACKYTPAGQCIRLSLEVNSDSLQLVISNSGVEIAATERDRIFDKFYRIPNNDPWKHGGTGLGLALVKKLTEKLGGKICVESGNGVTSFILEFDLSISKV